MAGKRTAYAVKQEQLRKEAKEKAKHPKGYKGQVRAVGGAQCGVRKRDGTLCKLAAGWGTPHTGIGSCKLHGGSVPNHIKAAAKAEYRQLFGTPMEINPFDAIMWCVKVRAGEVEWLSVKMRELDAKDWVEDTMMGKQFHLYARERQKAMQDLVRFSQTAISLGIDERRIKMAETYGALLAQYTQGLLDDLWPHLDAEGKAKAPSIVRGRLLALDAGTSPPPVPEHLQLDAA